MAMAAIITSSSLRSSVPLNLIAHHEFSSFMSSNQRVFFNGRILRRHHSRKSSRVSMFVATKPVIKDGSLSFNGRDALTCVPENVVLTPFTKSSSFLGATSADTDSRLVFKLGVLQDVRLMCLFRFKMWWMIPRVGKSGSDVPFETQMLLLEAKDETAFDGSTSYILFLPVLDSKFRSSLQGNSRDELELCLESGDPDIVASQFVKAVFVNYGNNPFDLMKDSMKILEQHSETFSVRESKQMPGMLDWFGWCTWDAFYFEVNPQGIKEGLKSLSEGGTPAKFLIIDDGWQNTSNEFQKEGEPFVEGTQFGGRLMGIEENHKFRKSDREPLTETPTSLKEFVSQIKDIYGLRYVYVWHALLGYWGGLHPNAPGTKKYNPELRFPVQSPGNLSNVRDGAMDAMEKYGVGTIDPEKASEFYDDLHKYLISQGVDGVKVDVQNILETIGASLGGRVSLTLKFQQALEESIATNFQNNNIICCMGQSADTIFHSKKSAITRASDDYYPKKNATQATHVAAVAFNSLFLGEIFVPDWDMFYSRHSEAEFHAIARAVGGCGIYVSDKPGQHDFNILKRLVLSDGSVLRARYPGRPTRDCLFNDPIMDGASLLKIWNLNKYTGVIGVFNCQGAGKWPCMENIVQQPVGSAISGQVSPADIDYLHEVSGELWTGDYGVFSYKAGSLTRLQKDNSFDVALNVLECDVYTVSPIKVYDEKIQFAPIGLIDMYNSGGAIEALKYSGNSSNYGIHIKGRGEGSFGAYSSKKPKHCTVNSKNEEFTFNGDDCFFKVTVPAGNISWNIDILY